MTPVEIMAQMESEIIQRMLKNLAKGNIGSAEWQADRLNELGVLEKDAAQIVRERGKEATDEVSALLREQAEASAKRVDRAVPAEKLTDAVSPEASPAVKNIMQQWADRAVEDISLTGARLVKQAERMYEEALEKAVAKQLTGAVTGREAMREIAQEWAEVGIPALIDRGGHRWSVEAYTQVVVRSNSTRVATQAQLARSQEVGSDLVEVSAHAGARPGCAPYQGRIYSISGDSDEYPPLSSTSYGEPAGLFGINCGHEPYPYVPGQSKKRYKPDNTERNEEQYRESQRQRGIERSIRQAKRERDFMQAMGDTEGAKQAAQKIRARQKRMREFIDETGRTRRSAREQLLT